jgi:hypothetical protein
MFIHIGGRKTISDKKVVGIFNIETIINSNLNKAYQRSIQKDQCDIKTIVIDRDNVTLCSKVSSFTVIKRVTIDNRDCVWRKK